MARLQRRSETTLPSPCLCASVRNNSQFLAAQAQPHLRERGNYHTGTEARYTAGMTKLRLAAAGINQTPLAWDTNRDHLIAALTAARQAQAAVLCLPELAITGYGCEDAFLSPEVQQTALTMLTELIDETADLVTTFGLPLAVEGVLYNAVAVVCDGRLVGFTAKQHLAGDGIHYEPRWFQPWPAGQVRDIHLDGNIHLDGKTYPVGDLLYDCGGIKIGLEICRDAWVDQRPGEQLARRGADILLNPSASHFAFGKQELRREFVLRAARDFQVSYAYANLLGNESGRAIFDGGTLLASAGEMVAAGPRLSFADWVLATADIDLAVTRRDQAQRPLPQKVELGGKTVSVPLSIRAPETPRPPTPASSWDVSPAPKAEEFARAVPLALFDYLRKSRAGGFVISLSGGADSSAVAAMVWLMVQLGLAELGPQAWGQKLAHIPQLADASDQPAFVRRLATCVYQATRNSGPVTRQAAETIATAIGAEFLEWNLDALVDGYVDLVTQATQRPLDWETDDIALQNIQARARGPGAWLLANLRGALLLATGNRSEAAVGYTTMDGDTCGGLAPITGIDKAYLLQWLAWLEQTGPEGVGPLPALQVVTSQQPTAELRPTTAGQTDEQDLMPYQVLDTIERLAIRDKLLPVTVWQALQDAYPQHDQEQLGQWVERFFRLWCRNQWKRERYAPSFHVDDENLDPKTWCRFPILSGGFERELNALRTAIALRKKKSNVHRKSPPHQ